MEDQATDLPGRIREMGAIYLDQIARLTEVIEQLAELRSLARLGTSSEIHRRQIQVGGGQQDGPDR